MLKLKAEELNDDRQIKAEDQRNKVTNERDNSLNNTGQQGADKVKDARQQLSNQLDDLLDEGKDVILQETGNKPEDAFDKSEDDLIARSVNVSHQK